jgi:hypothetical protein
MNEVQLIEVYDLTGGFVKTYYLRSFIKIFIAPYF